MRAGTPQEIIFCCHLFWVSDLSLQIYGRIKDWISRYSSHNPVCWNTTWMLTPLMHSYNWVQMSYFRWVPWLRIFWMRLDTGRGLWDQSGWPWAWSIWVCGSLRLSSSALGPLSCPLWSQLVPGLLYSQQVMTHSLLTACFFNRLQWWIA